MIRTRVTRRRYRCLVRGTPAVEVRVDRAIADGPEQTWWVRFALTRNATTNRGIIARGIRDLRTRIRASAIFA